MTALLVLLTVILFITIDYLVYRKKGTALVQLARDTVENNNISAVPKSVVTENDISLPQGVFLHPKHTWAYLLQSGKVKVGVDSFISKLINGVDRIDLPPIGMDVKKGHPFLNLFSKGKKLSLLSPIDGKVVALNNELLEKPHLLNDSYGDGWAVILSPSNLASDLASLKISSEAIKILRDEFKRFKEFILSLGNGNNLGLQTLQDGGIPVAGILTSLNQENWDKFQKEFLS